MERRQSDKVVWVNGTFDVMHIGHIKLLEFAKSLGDTLVVGIDDDSRVSELKGPDRPVNSLKDRMEFMSALKVVDEVVSFKSADDLRNWINTLKPITIVVGEEYTNREVIGSEFASSVTFFNKVGDHSTTNILSKNNKSS